MLRPLLSGFVLLALLAACDKADQPPTPSTDANSSGTVSNVPADPGSSPGTDPATAESSVAAPPGAVPPSDAAMSPDAPAGSTDPSNIPSQANPKELQPRESSTQMPLPGQVNNHSVPETTTDQKP